jgi:Zn-dependent peptidase ImmA (M78 family)/transcriptional regulator with XRE-family HTH domain
MSEKAHITPKVLKWARETAKMTVEDAAGKVHVQVSKIAEWEEGISQPTIRQAEILAKAYRRPFALLFLPDTPKDFTPLQDFRRKSSKPLGPASTFIIREIQQKHEWIKALNEENGEPKLPFVGKYTLRSNPEEVAMDMLQTLGIDPLHYTTDSPVREWIKKAEANGIFISRTSFIHSRLKLDSDELQGFCIADEYAPFVFVNSEDWEAPQLFTLVHELAHIWIAATGISNNIEPELKNRDKFHPVEIFCNQVTAIALMPASAFTFFGNQVYNSITSVFNSARKMGVSSVAFLYRAYSLNLISPEKYKKLKKEADAAFNEYLIREAEKKAKLKERQKEKPGGPDYYMLLVNKNSHQFTRIVMDAFRGGHIPPTQASSLLSTQINNFSKLEAWLYK